MVTWPAATRVSVRTTKGGREERPCERACPSLGHAVTKLKLRKSQKITVLRKLKNFCAVLLNVIQRISSAKKVLYRHFKHFRCSCKSSSEPYAGQSLFFQRGRISIAVNRRSTFVPHRWQYLCKFLTCTNSDHSCFFETSHGNRPSRLSFFLGHQHRSWVVLVWLG